MLLEEMERIMNENPEKVDEKTFVQIETDTVVLEGDLHIPERAEGIVVFVHGSGSSRYSPRNQFVAEVIREAGLATLLFDLLTGQEEEADMRTRHLRFDIDLLARRTVEATDWLKSQSFGRDLKVGYFGSSTGAAAALIAAV
jgi:putative phosphoribosyl transferase